MAKKIQACKQCGQCCFQEIPITLMDIHRIANILQVKEEEIFNNKIQDGISSKSGVYKIVKREDEGCTFLNDKNLCAIHTDKPNACTIYYCFNDIKDKKSRVTYCNCMNDNATLWEQSVAVAITREYISRNGTRWVENEYHNAIKAIKKNITSNKHQKIRLSKDQNGHAICQIYDCTECKSKGNAMVETIITIADLRRIAAFLNTNIKRLLTGYIDKKISSAGTYLLKRDVQCIFFDSEKHCKIEEVKPMHCRFTPCPVRTKSAHEFDRLYLGSGTAEEQYRHQLAIMYTKAYIQEHGLNYSNGGIKKQLEKLDADINNEMKFKEFTNNIIEYRYVEDTVKMNDKE
jgi:Fe-S-cluster containining protein